nr:sensor histidine kinase [Raoultella sp. NCTC 9187]
MLSRLNLCIFPGIPADLRCRLFTVALFKIPLIMPQGGVIESRVRYFATAKPAAWFRCLFLVCCGILSYFQTLAPAHAETHQLGIDIPVFWFADADGR